MFYVYLHTCPDGRIYIGQTKQPLKRWANGGGYSENEDFTKAIHEYGWANIRHEIIGGYNTETEARITEAVLIVLLNSEDENVGFNRSDIKEKTLTAFATRTPANGVSLEEGGRKENVLEQSGLPTSACEKLIDEWIFDKRTRQMLKDRLIDGMPHQAIAEKYGVSLRQAKNIIHEGSEKLAERLV